MNQPNSPAARNPQVGSLLEIVGLVGQAIASLGEVPSGALYARLCGRMDLDAYQSVIGLLKRAGLVTESPAHLLRWSGPALSTAETTTPQAKA